MENLPQMLEKFIGKPVEVACNLIESLLGEPFQVAGDILSDQIKMWQWKNRINIAEKAQKMLNERSIACRILPPDFLLPLICECGYTSDETLQEAWARLLSEAVADDSSQQISFIYTLKELSAIDVKILNDIIEKGPVGGKGSCLEITKRTGLDHNKVHISFNNLKRLGFFSPTARRVSGFGIDFMKVCLADKTKLDGLIEFQKKLNHVVVSD